MTRACYSLALLLIALGGSLVVTSPAKCQTSTDDYRFGFRIDETCPFVDGYIQTHGEDFQPVLADDATCDPDLRGRSVVAVLDDPAEAVADNAAAAEVDDQASFDECSFPESVAVDGQSSETSSTTTNSDQSDMRDSGCYDEYYFHHACPREAFGSVPNPATGVDGLPADGLATADPAASNGADNASPSQDIESVNDGGDAADVCNQGYLRDYYQRYRSEYVNPCQPDSAAGNESGCPLAEAQATADIPQYSKPYEAYDYSYHHGGSEAGSCPALKTEAVVELVNEVVDVTPEPAARDCEDECYRAYLQRCAEEAAAKSAVDQAAAPVRECEPFDAYGYEYRFEDRRLHDSCEPADTEVATADESAQSAAEVVGDDASCEPYGYADGYSDPAENGGYEQEAAVQAPAQNPSEPTAAASSADADTSYEVYDYYHGAPETVVREPQPRVEPAPSVPHYYGRYPYGYGYEYDYEYSKSYHSDVPADPTTEPAVTEAATPQGIDVLQWVDLGREFLGSVADTDLVDLVRAEADRLWTQVADVVETMNFDQVRDDATQAMAAAVQQPLPARGDWSDANVFLFMFESDLNAEPIADAGLAATPWIVEDLIVDQQPWAGQDAANVERASDDSVSTVTPIQREQVLQWARHALKSAVASWDRLTIELQRFAGRSMATVPGDNASSTQR